MKTPKRNRIICLLSALFLCMILLSGCQTKYEPIELPTLEAAEADIAAESTTAVEVEQQETAQSSALAPVVTTETAPAFTDVDETVYVTGDQVNVRKGAGSTAEVAARLAKGTALKRVGYNESWSKVIYNDQERYISSQFVSKSQPETAAAPTAAAVSGSGTGKIIAIDPGHQAKGNSEKEPIGPGSSTKKAKVASGTQGNVTGIAEYKLTLEVSKLLKKELESRGYQTLMIRETHDVNISNAERAEIANKSGADIFVRVHANSLDDTSVHGALTMCQTAKNPYNGNLHGKSSSLSTKVTDAICAATGFKNRGVQETDSMSGINWCKIPVTIVEMGFMSNAEEDKKMATDEYRQKIAKGIADGIDAYYAAGN